MISCVASVAGRPSAPRGVARDTQQPVSIGPWSPRSRASRSALSFPDSLQTGRSSNSPQPRGDTLPRFPARHFPRVFRRDHFFRCNSHQENPHPEVSCPGIFNRGSPSGGRRSLAALGTPEGPPLAPTGPSGGARDSRGPSRTGPRRAERCPAAVPGPGAEGSGGGVCFPRGGSPMRTAPATSSGRGPPALPRGAAGVNRPAEGQVIPGLPEGRGTRLTPPCHSARGFPADFLRLSGTVVFPPTLLRQQAPRSFPCSVGTITKLLLPLRGVVFAHTGHWEKTHLNTFVSSPPRPPRKQRKKAGVAVPSPSAVSLWAGTLPASSARA